jgi:N-acyl-D-amino-acid deacylase
VSFDIIIRDGMVSDGSGNPWYYCDIGLKKGKIIKMGKMAEDAKLEIKADNLIVCPGFIDTHSHTDFVLPFYDKLESFVQQGITTCVTGMCGNSLAPINPDKVDEFQLSLGNFFPLYKTFKFPWFTFDEYLAYLDDHSYSLNVISFVGYENIRIAGYSDGYENRLSTNTELESMKKYIKEAMEAGAFGLSTGLIYAPQVYVKTQELIELVKIVAKYDGLYFSHIRGEGETLLEAVREFIKIVDKSGCKGGQISHHKASGKKYWGKSLESLQLIDEANNRGLNITCDSYPYNRGFSSLVTALPPWSLEGGYEKTLERLKNHEKREKIKNDIIKGIYGWENWIQINGFNHIFISLANTDKWKPMEGKSISEITQILNKKNDWDTFFEILIDEDLGVQITLESMNEEDIKRILISRYQMIGTDGIAVPYDPVLGKFHPRFFGTYPRILGHYVRKENILTLEDAIRRMTSFPAQRLGIKDRGLLKEGNWGDIVIFDPKTIIDKATYEEPYQFPEGIHYVIVNGEIVIENGLQYEVFPGKILRRSK